MRGTEGQFFPAMNLQRDVSPPAKKTHIFTVTSLEMAQKGPMSGRMTFAEAVRRVRTSRRLTQAGVAKRAGLTRSQLCRIENGLKPGSGTYQRLVGALGFTMGDELFAAAGDRAARKRLAGYAESKARLKELAAARETESSAAFDSRTRAKPAEKPADKSAGFPVKGMRWGAA